VTIGGNYSNAGVSRPGRRHHGWRTINGLAVRQPAGQHRCRLGGDTAATFALSLFSAAANRFLNLELSALEAEGKGKIVSSPRV
jgi:type IV pilus assembly protein PilQ